jgi:hypothetical protein
MKSLYDVFRAIRADEADHVSTMKACLDENVLLISPSLERKLLTGTGIAVAAGALLSGGDLVETSDMLSLIPRDITVGGGSGFELDAFLAGAGAVISQLFGEGSEAVVSAREIATSVESIDDSGLIAQLLGEGFAAGLIASTFMSGETDEKNADKNMTNVIDDDVED